MVWLPLPVPTQPQAERLTPAAAGLLLHLVDRLGPDQYVTAGRRRDSRAEWQIIDADGIAEEIGISRVSVLRRAHLLADLGMIELDATPGRRLRCKLTTTTKGRLWTKVPVAVVKRLLAAEPGDRRAGLLAAVFLCWANGGQPGMVMGTIGQMAHRFNVSHKVIRAGLAVLCDGPDPVIERTPMDEAGSMFTLRFDRVSVGQLDWVSPAAGRPKPPPVHEARPAPRQSGEPPTSLQENLRSDHPKERPPPPDSRVTPEAPAPKPSGEVVDLGSFVAEVADGLDNISVGIDAATLVTCLDLPSTRRRIADRLADDGIDANRLAEVDPLRVAAELDDGIQAREPLATARSVTAVAAHRFADAVLAVMAMGMDRDRVAAEAESRRLRCAEGDHGSCWSAECPDAPEPFAWLGLDDGPDDPGPFDPGGIDAARPADPGHGAPALHAGDGRHRSESEPGGPLTETPRPPQPATQTRPPVDIGAALAGARAALGKAPTVIDLTVIDLTEPPPPTGPTAPDGTGRIPTVDNRPDPNRWDGPDHEFPF